MKSVLKIIGLALVALVAVVLGRTFMYTPDHPADSKASYTVDLDMDRIAGNLAKATTFKTISPQPPQKMDPVPFNAFLDWYAATYPEAHQAFEVERVAGYTLLMKWQGKNPSLKPVLLTGHYDVVPVIPGTENDWNHPPFGGLIKDGVIYGRGTLDDKGSVIAIMEAATHLLKKGYQPERTVYFSFGHDEEIGGDEGAAAVATLLKQRGVQLEWSLDEGSMVLDGIMPGIANPVAMINVTEKGYMTLELVAKAKGGHSSMPHKETAVGILAEAIVKLQNNPVPGGLSGVSGQMFDGLGPHFPFVQKMLFANTWLFGGVIETVLSGANTTNAMIRTTTAPTMLSGSIKENVLPIEAIGTVNFRLHPRDTVESVIEFVRQTINDDRIEIRMLNGSNAMKPASVDGIGYQAMSDGFRKVFDNVVVVAGMTVGGTDSKHYGKVADNAYRILPFSVTSEDIAGFHGTNERLTVENLRKGTVFYVYLLENATR